MKLTGATGPCVAEPSGAGLITRKLVRRLAQA